MIGTPRQWSLVVIAFGILFVFIGPRDPSDLTGRFDSPILAMQMSASLADVEAIVPAGDAVRLKTWRWFLLADCGFLVAYGVLYTKLAGLGLGRGDWWGRVASVGRWTAPVAALFDLGENVTTWLALGGSGAAAEWIRFLSLCKWGSLGLTAGLIAWVFLETFPIDSERKLLRVATMFLYLAAAIITAFGLADYPILERVTPALAAALVTQTIAFFYKG